MACQSSPAIMSTYFVGFDFSASISGGKFRVRPAARTASRNFAGDAVARQTLVGLTVFSTDEELQWKTKHNDNERVKNNCNNVRINYFLIGPDLLFECDFVMHENLGLP